MKERPILFSAPMVRAINEDRKWKTRRVVKPQLVIDESGFWSSDGKVHFGSVELWAEHMSTRCPYGQPGDRLWVREAWRIMGNGHEDTIDMFDRDHIQYRADNDQSYIEKYRPSIHMPRRFSRIDLEITGVCVERLNDISEADAVAEGITCESVIVDCNCHGGTHQEITAERYFYDGCHDDGFETGIDAYAELWEQINGPGSWAANPFVWVIEFKRITP